MAPPARTILVVDDDPAFLRDLRDLLKAFVADVEVLLASNGKDALAVLAGQEVDLLISDQSMPGMEGLELLETARLKYPDVPRILITGFNQFDLAMDAVNHARVTDFIPKPPNAERTISAVRRALLERDIGRQ
ncbi:MAG TPA: response regulator [Candidatus Thermoplasmatota archaeon]|nr:response regulator [Candidatus Thermoplasmatota archaeon]